MGLMSPVMREVWDRPRRFSLAAFMASQSDGFWFDFTKTDRLFQEDVGPTPANDPNEVIGLALSQRLWGGKTRDAYLAGQAELVTNGDFESASGWNVPADAAISGGDLTFTATAAARIVDRPTTLPQRLLRMELNVSAITGGSVRIELNSGLSNVYVSPTQASPGILVVYAVPSGPADTLRIRAASGTTATVASVSVKEVSRYAATQATTSFKPKYQTTGATGDGADDRLTLGYAAGSGENFLMLPKTTVPASLAATQVLAGGMDGSANGAYIAITTGGALRVKWGATTLDSTGVDLRNGVRDLGLWTDNGTLYLYADGVVVGAGAWTGTIPTTTWNLFALNNNGTASNFFAGSLKAALAGREAINLARANQICAAY